AAGDRARRGAVAVELRVAAADIDVGLLCVGGHEGRREERGGGRERILQFHGETPGLLEQVPGGLHDPNGKTRSAFNTDPAWLNRSRSLGVGTLRGRPCRLISTQLECDMQPK